MELDNKAEKEAYDLFTNMVRKTKDGDIAFEVCIFFLDKIINEGGTNMIDRGSNYYKEVKKHIESFND